MLYKLIYGFFRHVYINGLRDRIKLLIDDPDSDWDDLFLSILDKVFDYTED